MAEHSLCIALGTTLQAAAATLDSSDAAALQAEKATLQSRIDAADLRIRELYASCTRAADAIDAIGSDDVAARYRRTA